MPESRHLHTRVAHLSKEPSSPVSKVEAKVNVHVKPTEKHESFDDFYPLHVTKTIPGKKSDSSNILIAIGLILLILVVVAYAWFSLQPGFSLKLP